MRILMLAQFYPPDIGGEERHVHNLARAMVARGHHVEVVTSALGSTPEGSIDEDGVMVHRVRTTAQRLPLHGDAARPHAAPVTDPHMRRAIRRRGANVDVIHAHNWIVNSALGGTGAPPVVLTLHDYSHVCATKRLMRGDTVCSGPGLACLGCASAHYGRVMGTSTAVANAVARRRRVRRVERFVAVSTAVAELNALAADGVAHDVIPNFVPDDLLDEAAPPPSTGEALLYVGDLTWDKGVSVLVEAYERSGTPRPLWLVGRPSPTTPSTLPPGVELVGPLPHEAVIERMRVSRMVLVPSICPDACPTVVLEAMALGRPVIAGASGGIVDLVDDGATGVLVAPGDAARLARAISELDPSPSRLDRMGAAGRLRAAAFTASSVAARLEAVYEQAIARCR